MSRRSEHAHGKPSIEDVEICIYGGTAAGITAAVEASSRGHRVLLVAPERRLGGLSSGGLGQTDIGHKDAFGGLSRRFYEEIAQHYAQQDAWIFQAREDYRDGGQTRTRPDENAMWTFEPRVAESVFKRWVEEAECKVWRTERLDRRRAILKSGSRLQTIHFESGRGVSARIFIDATYEGDLMAASGITYRCGREACSEFGESLNGVQTRRALDHQFASGVDPYVIPGKADSGLLPCIDPNGPGREHSADTRIQAYTFRMCLTNAPANRLPFNLPENYDEQQYELLFRNFEAGYCRVPWINSSMPNGKTDTNNRGGFSTDFIGQNYRYPDASYTERDEVRRRHLDYQKGLMWTLAYHPRIPGSIRAEVSSWGVTADEFVDNGGWPDQLYVRECRRMVATLVMTQLHCEGRAQVSDSVGLAAYNMDSHNTQRYVDRNGHVRNEGDVQVKVPGSYPISYRSIIPRQEECDNLLIPVCLSATHIAYGSIRMEPVFMNLGQSAAAAAGIAIEADQALQEIDYGLLKQRLTANRQVLG